MIQGHGNDIFNYNNVINTDFSSNVWYDSNTNELLEYLKARIEHIKNYPDPDSSELKIKIAKLHNITSSEILVTNGSTEAFYLIAQTFSGITSNIFYPSFAEYEDACKIFKHKIQFHTTDSFNRYSPKNAYELVWIGNPNNPDGTTIKATTLEKLCEENPKTYFVIDEAYNELCWDSTSIIPITNRHSNLIIIKSFTKAFAIPGIRLGYAVASKNIISRMRDIKIPWSVNSLAIDAGLFICDNYNKLLPAIEVVSQKSIILQQQIETISGIEVHNSKCNFFLVKMESGSATKLKTFLIDRYGILIRVASNFRGLNDSFFRIAVQSDEENKLFIKGVTEFLNTQ